MMFLQALAVEAVCKLAKHDTKSFVLMVRDKKTTIVPVPVIVRIGKGNYMVFAPKPCGLFRLKYRFVSDQSFDSYIKAQWYVHSAYSPEGFIYFNDEGGRIYSRARDNGNLSGISYRRYTVA